MLASSKLAASPSAYVVAFVAAMIFGACNAGSFLQAPEVKPDAFLQLARLSSGDYLLSAKQEGTQPIFLGSRVTNIDWTKPYGYRQGKRTLIMNPGPADRYFLGMLAENGDTLIVSDSRLPLTGSTNFRDIGGIPTRDGRFVRWGQIYRSDRLDALTDEDKRYLESLGLATVYDFRSESEAAAAPAQLPTDVEYLNTPLVFDADDTFNIERRIRNGSMTRDEANNILVEANRMFGTDVAERFQPFIDCLLENKGPLVFHCTSGKDRTGFATMLLLSALNVGRDTILNDYLLSNYYRHELNQSKVKKLRYAAVVKRNLDIATITPLMIVDERYINSAYDAIENKYGTVDRFLEEEYGLTAEKRAELIDIYTYGPAITIDGEFVPAEEGDLEVPATPDSLQSTPPVSSIVPAAASDTASAKTIKLTKAEEVQLSAEGGEE